MHVLQKVNTYFREPGWPAAGARIKHETSKIEVAILTSYLYTQTLLPGRQFYIPCIALFQGTCNWYKSFILCVYQNRHICQCVAWSRHHLHILINDEWLTWRKKEYQRLKAYTGDFYHIMHQNYTRQAPESTYPIHADQTTTLMQRDNGKKQKWRTWSRWKWVQDILPTT